MTYCINYDIICTYLRGDGMLLYILWQCGLVLSTFINIPMSALAYMRFRLKDKEFYNYLKNRSAAKTFIKKRATLEDLEELTKIILKKKIELMKNRLYN